MGQTFARRLIGRFSQFIGFQNSKLPEVEEAKGQSSVQRLVTKLIDRISGSTLLYAIATDMDQVTTIQEPDRDYCKAQVLLVFQDICPKYLDEQVQKFSCNSEHIITELLDLQDSGYQYPKRENPRKRKRDEADESAAEDPSSQIKARIGTPEYGRRMKSSDYKKMALLLIDQDFPLIPKAAVSKILTDNGSSVFQAYAAIDDAIRGNNASWTSKKKGNKPHNLFLPGNIPNLDMQAFTEEEQAAIDEFKEARLVRDSKQGKQAAEDAEKMNEEAAKKNGEVAECGCCFEEFPLNRMVSCEGEKVHLFCKSCMKQQAETTIGYQKYELTCMSMDGCQAGFSAAQRANFLDEKLQIALDRIEQQAVLRMAGIENLETCPFCPYAMEYPPVEENKEFRCENPECEMVSCRLCRRHTHIPKTCTEAAIEEGHSARHQIEEAMSEAVIRKCNSCANPFIKQDGCNKITCTRCRTIQCYICRQTVKDYSHFNDANRGGKEGQCPLFDSTEDRHQNEAQAAEKETRQKVAQDNPDVAVEALQFRMSEKVQQDEQRRSRAFHIHAPGHFHGAIPEGVLNRFNRRLRNRVIGQGNPVEELAQEMAQEVHDPNDAPRNGQQEPHHHPEPWMPQVPGVNRLGPFPDLMEEQQYPQPLQYRQGFQPRQGPPPIVPMIHFRPPPGALERQNVDKGVQAVAHANMRAMPKTVGANVEPGAPQPRPQPRAPRVPQVHAQNVANIARHAFPNLLDPGLDAFLKNIAAAPPVLDMARDPMPMAFVGQPDMNRMERIRERHMRVQELKLRRDHAHRELMARQAGRQAGGINAAAVANPPRQGAGLAPLEIRRRASASQPRVPR